MFYGETIVDCFNENDWWVILGITAGPKLPFAVCDKFHFDLKLRFGLTDTLNYTNSMAGSDDLGGGFSVDFRTSGRHDILIAGVFCLNRCMLHQINYFRIHAK